MEPEPIEPTTEQRQHPSGDYTRDTHPAFGMIEASRVTANPGHFLYGSDLRHHDYVMVTIGPSTVDRHLSHDWHHRANGPDYVRVALSEAQWATFVSTLNMGDGVPCTIDHLNGKAVPGITRKTDRRAQFKAEMDQTIADGVDALKDLKAMIDVLKVPTSKKQELMDQVDTCLRELRANVPFVAQSFDEHVERTAERAKIEVNAYLTSMIQRAGLKTLQEGATVPLQLDASPGKDETAT